MMRLLFAGERAASVKVSGSGIFPPIQALWAAINTLQVIANNLPCTSYHFSCFSKDSLVIMNNIAINFADLITPCGSYNKFTASPNDTILRNWTLLTFLGVSSIQRDQRPESPCSGWQRPFMRTMWNYSHSQFAIAQIHFFQFLRMSIFNENASIKVNQVQIF